MIMEIQTNSIHFPLLSTCPLPLPPSLWSAILTICLCSPLHSAFSNTSSITVGNKLDLPMLQNTWATSQQDSAVLGVFSALLNSFTYWNNSVCLKKNLYSCIDWLIFLLLKYGKTTKYTHWLMGQLLFKATSFSLTAVIALFFFQESTLKMSSLAQTALIIFLHPWINFSVAP